MIDTLHEMRNYADQTTWGMLIAGIGQRNDTGPQIWAAISSPLFAIMQLYVFLHR